MKDPFSCSELIHLIRSRLKLWLTSFVVLIILTIVAASFYQPIYHYQRTIIFPSQPVITPSNETLYQSNLQLLLDQSSSLAGHVNVEQSPVLPALVVQLSTANAQRSELIQQTDQVLTAWIPSIDVAGQSVLTMTQQNEKRYASLITQYCAQPSQKMLPSQCVKLMQMHQQLQAQLLSNTYVLKTLPWASVGKFVVKKPYFIVLGIILSLLVSLLIVIIVDLFARSSRLTER